MKPLIPIAGALSLTLAFPMAAEAQERGNERGQGQARAAQDRDQSRDGRGDNRQNRREVAAVRREARAEVRQDNRGKAADRREARVEARVVEARRENRRENALERREDRVRAVRRETADDRREIRRAARAMDRPDPVVVFRRAPDRGLIAGCPPGLAWRNNGCLPPGQARKIARARDFARYDPVWNRGDDNYRYRYDGGYVYRLDPRGTLSGYLPVLGGALGMGQAWPVQYAYEPVPAYYADYYRLPDRYGYRYADGVVYGLDPETQAIRQVAALLTGQSWTVGQPMPAGYDVYNVPYDYRARYYDTPDRLYRYNDGYVYQVDPTTQLVQAVIQMVV